MFSKPTYRCNNRIVALGLALVFAVFNVGLPIIIYACPMMQRYSGSLPCCADTFSPSGSQIGVSVDRSCCKTVIASQRNTTEFLQAKDHPLQSHQVYTSVVQPNAAGMIADQSVSVPRQITAAVASPPDIPVLFSSLLI